MMMSVDESRNDDAVDAIDDSRIVFRILVKGDILSDLCDSIPLYQNIYIGQRKAVERCNMEAVSQKQHDIGYDNFFEKYRRIKVGEQGYCRRISAVRLR
jgi:hypothetical protein